MKIFDKPQRTQTCDCERSSSPNLSQALFLYNDDALTSKIANPAGRLAKLLKQLPDDNQVLDELYQNWRIAGAATGGLRLCPHVYNTMEHIDRAVHAVAAMRHLLA